MQNKLIAESLWNLETFLHNMYACGYHWCEIVLSFKSSMLNRWRIYCIKWLKDFFAEVQLQWISGQTNCSWKTHKGHYLSPKPFTFFGLTLTKAAKSYAQWLLSLLLVFIQSIKTGCVRHIKILTDFGKSYSDETRLSKLVKKIQRETERERRLFTAKQLVDHLYTPEGAKVGLTCTCQCIFFSGLH